MPYGPQRRSKRKSVGRGRLSAHQRGYDKRWQRYTRAFLMRPGNAICAICCHRAAECTDHIIAPSSRHEPGSAAYYELFWDESNHQPACLKCNSKKGNKTG